jgi:hypothetical protein
VVVRILIVDFLAGCVEMGLIYFLDVWAAVTWRAHVAIFLATCSNLCSYSCFCVGSHSTLFIGKAIQLQAWTGPEGSRRLRLQDFKTIGTLRW